MDFKEFGGLLREYPDPVESNGFLIPETFRTFFLIEDSEFDRRWVIELQVKIGEAGTPQATEVLVRGFTNEKTFRKGFKPFDNYEPIEKWQIETAQQNLNDLLTVSAMYAIEYFRYSGTKEDWSLPLKVRKDSLDSGQWELGSRGFENVDLKTLKKRIEKVVDRRGYTEEELLKTATLVEEEFWRAKNSGKRSRHGEVVASWFGITPKGAEYKISKARVAGYLTKENKVSIPKMERSKPKQRKKGLK
jgi:hypothetical protein